MANTNGLMASKDVCGTGAVASNYFLRKGAAIPAPTLVSPVSILSEDGTQTGVIQQNDNGNMVIYPQGGAHGLFLGNGLVSFPSPDNTKAGNITETNIGQMIIASGVGDLSLQPGTGAVYILSSDTNSSVELAMTNGGPFTIEPAGNTVVIGNNGASAGATLQVNGSAGVGRVYDTLYNTLPAAPASVVSVGNGIYTTSSSLVSGTITEPIADAVVPGIYMLQARVNLQRSQGGPAPEFGTSINSYLQTVVAPIQYIASSSFNILPSMLFAPAENGDNDATFTSGAFVVPAGSSGWNLLIEVGGSWNFNSGAITYQLLRLA